MVWIVLMSMFLTALAQDPSEAEVPAAVTSFDFFKLAAELEVGTEPPDWLDEPLVIEEGAAKITLDSGYVVPVWSGDGERVPRLRVGFVWLEGTGKVEVTMATSADAMIFANNLVTSGFAEKSDLVPMVKEGAPFSRPITQLVMISGAVRYGAQLAPLLKPIDDDDIPELVVVANRRSSEAAVRDAKALFTERRKVWKEAKLQVPWRLAMERFRQERYGISATERFFVMDFETDQRFPQSIPTQVFREMGGEDRSFSAVAKADTRWMSVLHDETGSFDSRLQTRVTSLQPWQSEGRTGVAAAAITGTPFPLLEPSDPYSTPAARDVPITYLSHSVVKVSPHKHASTVQVDVETRLEIEARGTITSFMAMLPLGDIRGGDDVEAQITVDGNNVMLTTVAEDGQVWIALPRPLLDGERQTLVFKWQTAWSYGNQVMLESGELVNAGETTGNRSVLPMLAPVVPGAPTRFDITVQVPTSLKLDVAISGLTLQDQVHLGTRIVRAEHTGGPALWPSVALGRWKLHDEPAQAGFPAIRVHLFGHSQRSLAEFGPEIRRSMVFYDEFLPSFAFDEIEVVELAASPKGVAWSAPHGLVTVSQMIAAMSGGLRDDAPHLEHGVLAHEVAHHWFGHVLQPAHTRDMWMAESLAETYACMYLQRQFQGKDCMVRMASHRKHWTKELAPAHISVPASLTSAYDSPYQTDIVYRYGPFVLHEQLRRLVGNEAFYAAINDVLEERFREPVTTEALKAALEKTSGQDLTDFFDWWIYGGFIPRVRVLWSAEKADGATHYTGTVDVDVPFGTVWVPVEFHAGGVRRLVEVKVVDGSGTFDVAVAGSGRKKVVVDPLGRFLARDVKVKQRD